MSKSTKRDLSEEQFREAAQAKRTIPTADLTDAQCDVIDAAWDRSKYDPELQRKRREAESTVAA